MKTIIPEKVQIFFPIKADTKFVLKKKKRADGEISSFKAAFVARVFNQDKGIDFHGTFAPVGCFNLLSIDATNQQFGNRPYGYCYNLNN